MKNYDSKAANEIIREAEKIVGDKYVPVLTSKTLNNGGDLDQIAFRKRDQDKVSPVGVCISLEDVENAIQNGRLLELIEGGDHLQNMTLFEELSDGVTKEFLEKNLYVQVINTERNKSRLDNIPHRDYLDLSLVMRIRISVTDRSLSSVVVSGPMCGLTEDEMFEIAFRNTPGLFGKHYEELFGGPPKILTNDLGLYGASLIYYDDILKKIGEDIGGDFYVLPCSIHKVLVIAADRVGFETEEVEEVMKRMIHEANTTTVSPEEILSDSLYYYDMESGLRICS